jgi:hypothetical protein
MFETPFSYIFLCRSLSPMHLTLLSTLKWQKSNLAALALLFSRGLISQCVLPVFLNVYGAQESIPRNEFRQPM